MDLTVLTTSGWSDYALLDSGNARRLERFGEYILDRPDPQACWLPQLPLSEWSKAHAVFEQHGNNRGGWKVIKPIPKRWKIGYKNLSMWLELTPFKHTGIFPEQQPQWDCISDAISKANRETHVLNLFGYTGVATLTASSAGAKVTHVDASKPAVTWAHENHILSGLSDKPVRWIIDDAVKYVTREIRRGVRYDGIIMDPPIYGHGPTGEIWDLMRDLPGLIKLCREVLTEKPLFVIVNTYAVTASALMLYHMLSDRFADLQGKISCGELCLKESTSDRLLSTGIYARWQCD